jgi:hypothetical protein
LDTVPHPPRQRQRGTIAILFGLTLLVLLAAGGLVLDLGHLYILKSELQNAADSAALAGAKELNLSSAGITSAAAQAVLFAGKNKYDFSQALTITDANITFGSTPDGPWFTVGQAQASPAGKTFIRVQSGSKVVATYLMRALNIDTVATNGTAVAGRFVVDITPIGVCAVDPVNRTSVKPTGGVGTVENELVEFGFRRGLTYDLLQMSNIGGSADPMLINPVDSPPTACAMTHSNANFTAPFLCQGNSAVTNNATEIYANTGVSAGPVEKAINSRYGDYTGSSCQPATAPPDTNIHEFRYEDLGGGSPRNWMTPAQIKQSQPFDSSTGKPAVPGTATTWGVMWSYSRAVRATGSAPNYNAGTPFEVADWSRLYNGGPAASAGYPAGATSSPYGQTSGAYYQTQSVNPAAPKRRQLNLALINCATVTSNSMSCKKLPLLGVGRFFLQRRVALSGSSKRFDVEFAGLIEPVPNAEIKLYR